MFGFKRVMGKRGFTATEILIVTTIITSISSASFLQAKNKAREMECKSNLTQIAMGLRMYEMTNGKLPKAAFFPGDAKKDKDSISVIMKKSQGYPEKMLICPAAPKELSEKGLTFLWNDKFSGKRSARTKEAGKTWLLIEINAVSDKVPPPHPGGFMILFADLQTIKTVKEVPEELAKEITAKHKEAETDEE